MVHNDVHSFNVIISIRNLKNIANKKCSHAVFNKLIF